MNDSKNFIDSKNPSILDHSLNNITKIPKKLGNSIRIKPKFYKMFGQILNSHIEVTIFLKFSQFLIILI